MSITPRGSAISPGTTLGLERGHRITFPEQPETHAWYNQRMHLKIATIQYRKEFRLPFRHEFLVVHLSDGSVCRFDRRPDLARVANRLEALTEHGPDALDTVEDIYPEDLAGSEASIESTSDCLAIFRLQNQIYLHFIFLVCYGIQDDHITRRYTLQKYNCYFFSWTIILNIARTSVTWERLPFTSRSFIDTLTATIVSEICQVVTRGLLDRVLIISQKAISEALSQIAAVLPSRLAIGLPSLPQEKLSHALQNAANSRNPLTVARWRIFGIRMAVDLEQTLTEVPFQEKLSRLMNYSLNFSGELGDSLYDRMNAVLKETLWRHKLKDAVAQAAREIFIIDDLEDGYDIFSDYSGIWKHIETTVAVETTCKLRTTALHGLSELVRQVVARFHTNTSNVSSLSSSWDYLKVIHDTADATLCDVLQDAISSAFRTVIRNEKNIKNSITRALGSAVSDTLPNIPVPFSLQVSNTWSVESPLLLKDEIQWHLHRWATKTTKSADRQVSHSILEQYFMYRISAHSRSVGHFGSRKETQQDIEQAVQRVWKVVSDIPSVDVK